MTPIAALVAEAIQLARENTPPLVNDCARVTYRGTDSAWAWYTRDDVRDAALAHLATKAAEAEGRAERAEARATRLREALALMSDAESPCGPLAHTIAVFALGTDDTAAGKGVG